MCGNPKGYRMEVHYSNGDVLETCSITHARYEAVYGPWPDRIPIVSFPEQRCRYWDVDKQAYITPEDP